MNEPDGVQSLLDSDLYKFTMLAAILEHYPDAEVSYKFTNRSKDRKLSEPAVNWLKGEINKLSTLSVSGSELEFLKRKCPYMKTPFLDYLAYLRLDPKSEVQIDYDPANRDLSILITGRWSKTILYEIPILALVSEAYFKFEDRDWNHEGQEEQAYQKGCRLIEAGCMFSDFGARRRRDFKTHDMVIQGLLRANKDKAGEPGRGKCVGTSNVHLAYKYDLQPIGTVAHEWFMATAAMTGNYPAANRIALDLWHQTYGANLGIALTDTFGTETFLKDFTNNGPDDLAPRFSGLRQDSGDPEEFLHRAVQHYRDIGIDPKTKTIVFSDSLNTDKAISLKNAADKVDINASFGIGTFFTNDFRKISNPAEKSPALNIVIKIASCQGRPAVKISDDFEKNTGDKHAVEQVKSVLGIL